MISHLNTLRERRLAVIALCDDDRRDVADAFLGLQHELRVADKIVSVAQGLNRNRVVMGALAVGLVVAPVFARKWIRRASWWLPIVIQGYRVIRQSSRPERGTRRRSDHASAAE
jgi:hypothetical protein